MLDPLRPFLADAGVMILDGGFATELERRGQHLGDDPLWSARLLLDDPDLIGRVHGDYLDAGADCITSASYQATIAGLARRGLDAGEALALIRRSVELATTVRDSFWAEGVGRRLQGRRRPLVAASVGPYGAFLADGSEFRGDYDCDEQALAAFHRQRLTALAAAGADLLACETVPSALEARVLARLVAEHDAPAWLSFSCRDGRHISDGTAIAAIAAELDDSPLLALGVNCTAPRFIAPLIAELRAATAKPIVVYPNSGERWDAARRAWAPESPPVDLAALSGDWYRLGARVIGGCCRTGPADVAALRRTLAEVAART